MILYRFTLILMNAYMQNLATGCLSRRQTLCCSLYNTCLTQSVVKLDNPTNPLLFCNVVTSKREKSCNERHLKPNALLHSSGKLAKNVMIHVCLFSFDSPKNDLRACPYFVTQGSKTFKHSNSSRFPTASLCYVLGKGVDLDCQFTLSSFNFLISLFTRSLCKGKKASKTSIHLLLILRPNPSRPRLLVFPNTVQGTEGTSPLSSGRRNTVQRQRPSC